MARASCFALACVLALMLVLSAAHPLADNRRRPTSLPLQSVQMRPLWQTADGRALRKTLRGFTSRTLTPDVLAPLRDDVHSAQPQQQSRNIHDVAANATPIPHSKPDNYTLDLCHANHECKDDLRNCLLIEDAIKSCEAEGEPGDLCFCWPKVDPVCETSNDCIPEEFCALPKGVKYQLCVSRNYENYPAYFKPVDPPPPDADEENPEAKDESGDEGETCIDARALGHFAQRDLVFARHSTARVLCDSFGSCATPGHVVVFKGKPMMMRTYCAGVRCENRVIAVNSPRYRRALRVTSRTDGLEYTPFAARYETAAEEAVMKMAVRAGL